MNKKLINTLVFCSALCMENQFAMNFVYNESQVQFNSEFQAFVSPVDNTKIFKECDFGVKALVSSLANHMLHDALPQEKQEILANQTFRNYLHSIFSQVIDVEQFVYDRFMPFFANCRRNTAEIIADLRMQNFVGSPLETLNQRNEIYDSIVLQYTMDQTIDLLGLKVDLTHKEDVECIASICEKSRDYISLYSELSSKFGEQVKKKPSYTALLNAAYNHVMQIDGEGIDADIVHISDLFCANSKHKVKSLAEHSEQFSVELYILSCCFIANKYGSNNQLTINIPANYANDLCERYFITAHKHKFLQYCSDNYDNTTNPAYSTLRGYKTICNEFDILFSENASDRFAKYVETCSISIRQKLQMHKSDILTNVFLWEEFDGINNDVWKLLSTARYNIV